MGGRDLVVAKPREQARGEWEGGLIDVRDSLAAGTVSLEGAIADLPADVRDRLARGPHPWRWTCGVCEAFGAAWYLHAPSDVTDPMYVVFAYHELPKIGMRHRSDEHYGELANDVYRRCIDIYRAAGWTGEAREPDA